MKLTVNRKELSTALKMIVKVANGRGQFPVLNAVKLGSDGSVYAINLEQSLSLRVMPETVAEAGEVVVPAVQLNNVIAKLVGDSVELLQNDGDSGKLVVKAGRSKATLLTLADQDMPALDTGKDTASFAVQASELRRLVEKTAYATADDSGRPFLCGLKFDQEGGLLKVAATDGNRLAVATGQVMPAGPEAHAIVPNEAVGLLRTLLEDDCLIRCLFGDRGAVFMGEGWELRTRLIEGTYPNYSRVIPSEQPTKVTVNRAELLGAVERAAVLAGTREGASPVHLNIGDEIIRISARQADIGDYTEEIVAEIESGGLLIAFQHNFLSDALKAATGERVVLGFGGPLSPATVRDPEDDRWLTVIMPVRMG